MTRAHIHRYVLIGALSGLAVGLPFSKAILSISGLVLAVNFLIEGQFNAKLTQLKQTTWAQLWLGVFMLHVIGLLWTTDFAYAADDIRTKLPLLLLPVVIGSTRINEREWRIILHLFISAVFLASVINWYVFVHDGMDDDLELRNLSLFTSHIRFALMIIIALILSATQLQNSKKKAKFIYLFLIGWFIYYTWFSQVLSGYVSFGLILIAASIYWLGKHLRSRYKPFAAIFLAVVGSGLLGYIFWTIQPPVQQEIDRETVVWYTENGNPYTHEHENGLTENGYYIYSYLSMEEIKREWNKVSKIDFDSTDAKGDPLYGTLIRYMTSQGLRKDSADFQKLTPKDIHYVEQGIASVVYLRGGMRGRLARISMDIQIF